MQHCIWLPLYFNAINILRRSSYRLQRNYVFYSEFENDFFLNARHHWNCTRNAMKLMWNCWYSITFCRIRLSSMSSELYYPPPRFTLHLQLPTPFPTTGPISTEVLCNAYHTCALDTILMAETKTKTIITCLTTRMESTTPNKRSTG